MPKRTDINSILIIGSGPIVIGQACEFDYSGVQACQALREEGYRVVLLNSNPATIMTDKSIADATYVEPLTIDNIKKIIKLERVDAILPTMGGQTALNLAMDFSKQASSAEFSVKIIGANPEVIEKAENRDVFYKLMREQGLECPQGYNVCSYEQALEAIEILQFPVLIRSSFTLGGAGSGFSLSREEFEEKVQNALKVSPIHQVFIEESIYGWKEYEMEVMRDCRDNCVIVCSIENIDSMGIHTGDSITVAPALTLTDKEYQSMRDASFKIMRAIGVETGGANIQFAIHPETGRMVVIEMNPRVSRSSALASKATGFPIAKIAAKLAVGFTLDEIPNEVTQKSCAAFEPSLDYIVTKIPRFDFEKFPELTDHLTTSMQSVGEVMAIGRTFKESFQKAIHSLEKGLSGLKEINFGNILNEEKKVYIEQKLKIPNPERYLYIAEAFRFGLSMSDVQKLCHWDRWFLDQIEALVEIENNLKTNTLSLQISTNLRQVKSMGFSNQRLSELTGLKVKDIQKLLNKYQIKPVFRRVDTCAAEFSSTTAYLYSTYLPFESSENACEAEPSSKQKVIIIGSGPNHIGQGIEFDYCCVHASYALQDCGIESILINCNPETVSTDHTISDKLYFSPLTDEYVLEMIMRETMNGEILGVIVQLGGQTSLKLIHALSEAGIPVLGTSVDSIDIAEDRKRCRKLIEDQGFRQPKNSTANTIEELHIEAKKLGYPIILRPSYVIGGKFMEIIRDQKSLENSRVLHNFHQIKPVLIETFLENAQEIEIDAICDEEEIYVGGIVEHFEKAGIHSGDSSCILPAQNVSLNIIEKIKYQTKTLASKLKIKGFINIQFALIEEDLYVLEINPRASRTIPFISKATDIPLVYFAVQVMAGKPLASFRLGESFSINGVALKKPVFSFHRLKGVDPLLTPEMRSTGEIMYLGKNLKEINFKILLEHFPLGLDKSKKIVILSGKDYEFPLTILVEKLDKQGYSVMSVFNNTIAKKVLNDIVEQLLSDKVSIIVNFLDNQQTTSEYRIAILNSSAIEFKTLPELNYLSDNIHNINFGSKPKIKPLQFVDQIDKVVNY